MDDQPIARANDLLNVLENHKTGDAVKVKILRDGEAVGVNVTLTGASS